MDNTERYIRRKKTICNCAIITIIVLIIIIIIVGIYLIYITKIIKLAPLSISTKSVMPAAMLTPPLPEEKVGTHWKKCSKDSDCDDGEFCGCYDVPLCYVGICQKKNDEGEIEDSLLPTAPSFHLKKQ